MNFCTLKRMLGIKRTLSKLNAPKKIINEEVKVPKGEIIISETDKKGFITYANEIFITMSAYSKKELLCANHNLIRHPDIPKIAFKFMWNVIENGNLFEGFVKNLRKDGKYYLVYAKIKPKGKKYYISVREEVNYGGWHEIYKIYKMLLDIEKQGGMEASYRKLKELLKTNDTDFYKDYMKFLRTLQYG